MGSINAGMKPASKCQPDLVLVASDGPSSGAAVFTKNEFPAPSITVSKKILQNSGGHGINGVIANSWYANLFTGEAGLDDSKAMSLRASEAISGERRAEQDSSVMVMHTGMGGER